MLLKDESKKATFFDQTPLLSFRSFGIQSPAKPAKQGDNFFNNVTSKTDNSFSRTEKHDRNSFHIQKQKST